MKALVCYAKEEHSIDLRDVPTPEIGALDCLVKVKYCGICGSDIHRYHGRSHGDWSPPVVLGHEWSGQIAEVGAQVQGFHVGDRVVAEGTGAFAPFVKVPANVLRHVPESLTFEMAAMTEPLVVAYQAAVHSSRIRVGDTVVVIGPGIIGLYALQLAKMAGAGAVVVTGTTNDQKRLAVAKALGADAVVDVSQVDPLDVVRSVGDGQGAHLVIDAAGPPSAVTQSLALVRRYGQITKLGWALAPVNDSLDTMLAKEVTYQGILFHTVELWDASLSLLERNAIQWKPLLSDVLPLSRWREAFTRLESREAIKILLSLEE
jgi:alcohol dehydrogenase/L-iditol 2-dehydrogenase